MAREKKAAARQPRRAQQQRRKTAGSSQQGGEQRKQLKLSTTAGRRPNQTSHLKRTAVRRVPQNLRRDSASPAQILGIAAGVCVAFGALYAIAWMAGQGTGAPPTSERRKTQLAGWGEESGSSGKRRRLKKVVSAKATDKEQQQRVAALERELLRIDKKGQGKGGRRFNNLLEEWRAFAEKTRGLALYDYAMAMIEELEAEKALAAEQGYRKTLGKVRPLANSGYWIEAFGLVDGFIRRFSGSPAAERMAEERKRIMAMKKLAESATFRIVSDFSSNPPKLNGVRILRADKVGKASPNEPHIRFMQNYGSVMVFQFDINQQLPKQVWLRVGHLMAYTRMGPYAPITIVINDKVLVGDWSPYTSHGFGTSRWEIRRYLRPGVNTIAWQLGEARTQYWLRRWEISDWQG